jgi:endonuclease VIII
MPKDQFDDLVIWQFDNYACLSKSLAFPVTRLIIKLPNCQISLPHGIFARKKQMPEGPSLILLKEQLTPFTGRTVTAVGGYTKMKTAWIKGRRLLEIQTWGKHLLFRFSTGSVRVHLMLFGSVVVNKRKKVNASFYLRFGADEINFYVVQAKQIEGRLEDVYDWRTDILSSKWSLARVRKLALEKGKETVGDLLLDQQVFTGSGNIIRVEAMYRSRIHPGTMVKDLPAKQLDILIKGTREYAKQFLKDKKAGVASRNWEAYDQEYCHRDDIPFNVDILGKVKRKTYYCNDCQVNYSRPT